MHILVLGAAAGGGLPQWNCGCENCVDARNGQLQPATQSSIAVSVDGFQWVLLNASPDIGAQLQRLTPLHPKSLRGSPISSVVLTNGDIDHIAGLLTLREKTAFKLYATSSGHEIIKTNTVFGVLDPQLVSQQSIALDMPFSPLDGLTITPFAVPGKVALFLESAEVNLQEVGEQTIGLMLESNGKRAAYVPGCAALPDWLLNYLSDLDLLMFDGTVWHNDDMARTGTGQKTGLRMGHIPINGPQGSLVRLKDHKARKVYVHINNTNPIWQPCRPERIAVQDAGWEIAFDGMELSL